MKKILINFLICLVIVIAAFIYDTKIGLIVIVLLIGFLFYRSRAQLLFLNGNAQFHKGNISMAKTRMEQALRINPNHPNYLASYSYLLLRENETELAGEVISRAKLDQVSGETEISLKLNQTIVLWRQGKQDESLALAEELYAKYKNSVIYGTLGYYYILRGDLEQALEFNKEAFDYNDSDKAILDNLGLTYYYLKEYEEAKALYEKLMELNPRFREAYYNYGLLLESMGEEQEALEIYTKSIQFRSSLVSHVTEEEIKEKIASLEAKHPKSVLHDSTDESLIAESGE